MTYTLDSWERRRLGNRASADRLEISNRKIERGLFTYWVATANPLLPRKRLRTQRMLRQGHLPEVNAVTVDQN